MRRMLNFFVDYTKPLEILVLNHFLVHEMKSTLHFHRFVQHKHQHFHIVLNVKLKYFPEIFVDNEHIFLGDQMNNTIEQMKRKQFSLFKMKNLKKLFLLVLSL